MNEKCIFKIECKSIGWIENHLDIVFFITISFFGLAIRYFGLPFISGDMKNALIPWAEHFKNLGGKFSALKDGIGDYNILYQTFVILICKSKNVVFWYKLFSIVFDYILALAIGLFAAELKNEKVFSKSFNVGFSAALFLPTVILNSAYWGQCDSIYCAFCILALCFFHKEKFLTCFAFFGIALAFKLQAIFLLPFFICDYFYSKKFSASNFFFSIFVFWATGIIAFIYGRGIFSPFKIYLHQAKEYNSMFLNVTSFWILAGENFNTLKKFAVVFTVFLCGMFLYLVMSKKIRFDSFEEKISFATFLVWTCVYFLPAMHERYTYMLDILFVLLVVANRRFIKYALFSSLCSTMTYAAYLFQNPRWGGVNTFLSFIYLFLYVQFLVKEILKNDGAKNEQI